MGNKQSKKKQSKKQAKLPGAGKHVAILLAGCGVYDGSECTEAVSMILHLERNGCTFDAFAPDKAVAHTVDHTKGEASEDPVRNVMVESSRIVRGSIKDLSEFDVSRYHALVIPGGFGAMKNLCTYAIDGADKYEIDDEVKKMILDCIESRTVVGLSCIAPMLLPKVMNGLKFTVGKSEGEAFPYAGTVADAVKLGANHTECDNDDVVVDEENLIVTAPAFMKDAGYFAVFNNIGQMIDKVVTMM
jgi:enhancing lycopene biosynthesis protein 2